MTKEDLTTGIFYLLMGIAGSLIIGIVFFGSRIFSVSMPPFQFVAGGIFGAATFALIYYNRVRDAAFILLLLVLVNFMVAGTRYFLTQLLFIAAIVMSAYIFASYFYRRLSGLPSARPLILAGLLAVGYLLVTIILKFVYAPPDARPDLLVNLPMGFLLGIGLGLGFETTDYFKRRSHDEVPAAGREIKA